MEGQNQEQKKSNQNLFFGIVGIMTFVIAIIGATFAYFTATQTAGANVIKGNAATIGFDLNVVKVTTADDTHGGLIPLTNGMIEAAVSANEACVDDNSNAVCQIYKITISNTGSASMFLDGYVNLTGGTGNSTRTSVATNMRWVEVFASGSGSGTTYSVTGTPSLAVGATGISALSLAKKTSNVDLDNTMTTGNYTLVGSQYQYINKNYMRTSGKTATSGQMKYTRSDVNNALVFNQYLAPSSDSTNSTRDIYIAVWLTETGTNQTMSSTEVNNFFAGSVTFNSAQGGEITATFGSYTKNPRTD